MCGHLYWTLADDFGLPTDGTPSEYMIKNNETYVMHWYAVDMGVLVTIPLFFCLSGYVTSMSWRNGDGGMLMFMKKRFLRLILPWIFGTLVGVIPRYVWVLGNPFDPIIIIQSEMWFLFVLFAGTGCTRAAGRWGHQWSNPRWFRAAIAVADPH